jgi:tricorn protease
MLKKTVLFCFVVLISQVVISQPLWLRYNSISPDGQTIVFTYKGDLYKVSSIGGSAVQLTTNDAHDFMPVWSNDSKTIAFASDRFGNFDIFTINVNGGEPKRITLHSAQEYPYSFTNDDKEILFGGAILDDAKNRLFPTNYMSELYKININGGRYQQILTTPAEEIKFNKAGTQFIYQDKKAGENQWRKHHTSAVARDIILYDITTKTHKKIIDTKFEDRNPVFSSDEKSIFYLSEAQGSFNIHKAIINGGASTAVTTYKKNPVRFLSRSKTGTLCFNYSGEIYTIKEGDNPQKVNITIATDFKSNNEQVLKVSSGNGISASSNGKEVAFIYRGEVFVTSVEGGVTKRITTSPEQETEVSFSPDGKSLIYCTERNGKWSIYESKIQRKEEPYFYAATLIKETPIIENANNNTQPLYSPDGKEIAFIENRNLLKILNIATKQTRLILNSEQLFGFVENDQNFTWSPDSKWLLFDYSMPGSASGEVGLIAVDGASKPVNLTLSGFNDYNPKWVLGGKAITWQSNRDGLRAASASGGAQSDVYAMFLNKDAYDRFLLNKEDFTLLKDIEEQKAKADTSKKKATVKDSVIIDWDGLANRKVKLTIHSSNMGDAVVTKDGETLYYLARFEKGMNLWSTNLRTKETKMAVPLNAGRASMQWDKEQKSLFLNADGGIIKLDPSSGKQDRVSISGEITIDALKEKMYQFDHVWRRTKRTFYTKSLHGTDWDYYQKEYEKFIPHISNNYEMSELLAELLGELNVSHSGSSYTGFSATGNSTASLGCFYDNSYIGSGVKILEIIKGGPLDKAVLKLKEGMVIESIDGETITADKDIAGFLNRKAGTNVLLGLTDGNVKMEIAIKPISQGEQSRLLYTRWVKRNADEVEKLSGGALGYVHIPGMNDGAFRTTYEDIMGKYFDKKAIVVDTRNNGGGDLVADLATFLSGKKFMDYGVDNRSVGYEPNFRWTKPSISLINEGNYSDGHCYAFMIQEMQISKLVGMPVPGTCTFAAWEGLMDTGISWGAPTVGCKDNNGKYLENAQTEPNFKVPNTAEKATSGIDEQLIKAVQELMKEIK